MAIDVKSTAWPHRVKEPMDSGAILDYALDWSVWLPEGSTIMEATWVVVGGAAVSSTIIGSQTKVWLSVTPGSTEVQATVHITLDTVPVALEDERTLILKVKER